MFTRENSGCSMEHMFQRRERGSSIRGLHEQEDCLEAKYRNGFKIEGVFNFVEASGDDKSLIKVGRRKR
jgi:hypothetical protein